MRLGALHRSDKIGGAVIGARLHPAGFAAVAERPRQALADRLLVVRLGSALNLWAPHSDERDGELRAAERSLRSRQGADATWKSVVRAHAPSGSRRRGLRMVSGRACRLHRPGRSWPVAAFEVGRVSFG